MQVTMLTADEPEILGSQSKEDVLKGRISRGKYQRAILVLGSLGAFVGARLVERRRGQAKLLGKNTALWTERNSRTPRTLRIPVYGAPSLAPQCFGPQIRGGDR